MQIMMLETRKGTEDGYRVRQFLRGEIYDVREHLARTFYAKGYARPATDEEILQGETHE